MGAEIELLVLVVVLHSKIEIGKRTVLGHLEVELDRAVEKFEISIRGFARFEPKGEPTVELFNHRVVSRELPARTGQVQTQKLGSEDTRRVRQHQKAQRGENRGSSHQRVQCLHSGEFSEELPKATRIANDRDSTPQTIQSSAPERAALSDPPS